MTSERVTLLRFVCSTTAHFTQDQLMESLRLSGARVSQATVYRTLPLLEQAGIIRRVSLFLRAANGAPLFEHVGDREHHDHLVCTRCGHTVEFLYPGIEALQNVIAEEHGFRLDRHHLELIGLCPECREPPRAESGHLS